MVRDSPPGRRALAQRTYEGSTGHRRSFRRAELAFIDWQLRRGVLEPMGGERSGSAWWRACNERLLCDGLEAVARSAGRRGPPASPASEMWTQFIDEPSAKRWYRAHNASIVSAYLAHRELAEGENESERFFMNVVLLRVLFAHAMVAAPRLATGVLAPLAPALGDPRVRMTGLFLSVSRVLPERYPLQREPAVYVTEERHVARLLDYGIIGPRLEAIYAWSAEVLEEPRLVFSIQAGLRPRLARRTGGVAAVASGAAGCARCAGAVADLGSLGHAIGSPA